MNSENEKYRQLLDLLEEYDSQLMHLTTHLSSGLINLARANYVGSNTGKPFGRDYYDNRVKATAIITTEDETSEMKLAKRQSLDDTKLPDPLRMFGLLVPIQLRSSQSDFQKALAEVVDLVNLTGKINKLTRELQADKNR